MWRRVGEFAHENRRGRIRRMTAGAGGAARERWVGLESNPEVMTQYARKLGVASDWAFTDCWGLEDDALAAVPQPCLACIFLYPFSQVEARKAAFGARRAAPDPRVWHMRQLVHNACGAVAIMHSVMNNMPRVRAPCGASFLESFDRGASSHERGQMFTNDARAIHSDLAARGQTAAPAKSAELDFHFVSLVGVDGRLWELDGNNDGPVDCGPLCDDLLRAVSAPRAKD